MTKSFVVLLFACHATLVAVLLLDGPGVMRQGLLGVATIILLWQCVAHSDVAVHDTLLAIAVASAGEVALSLGWHLYSYRHALIPLYVPPGHGVFYTLAVVTAGQRVVRRNETAIVRAVVLFGTAMTCASLLTRHDVWGAIWFAGFLCLMAFSDKKAMLASCFLYTLILEFAGTALGNWRWSSVVPFLGIPSANPPVGVGILYAAVDLSVVMLRRKRGYGVVGEQALASGVASKSTA